MEQVVDQRPGKGSFWNSENPKNSKFTNSGLPVCSEDIFVKVGRYYIFYLIICSLDVQLTYKYLDI